MSRVLVVAVAVLSLAGCSFGVRTCAADAECETGAVCRDNFCVLPDSGAGGGTGGGGNVSTCSPACAEWQGCSPSGCSNARLTAVSPASGAEFSGGETVRFVFSVTDWDGGVWPTPTIPASTSGGLSGPAMLMKVGTTFEGDFVLANTTGMQSVRAGWAEASATIQVRARTCSASCQPWEGCVADSDGGSCADLGLTLAWVEPDAGQQFGPRDYASVPLRLTASRADGGPFSSDVPYALDGAPSGMLSRSGAFWTATVDAGATSGARTLTAGWSGGPQATRSFEVVTTAPTVALVASLPPSRSAQETDEDFVNRWKKSEVAVFRVESNRPLVASGLVFSVPGVAPLPAASCPPCGDVACLCYGVELARQPLLAGIGTVTVSLTSGEDVLGNSLAPGAVSETFPVTRLKWKRELASSLSNAPLPLALTSSGIVVTGARLAVGGELWNVTPDGGATSVWVSATDGITAGPLVGVQQDTFVATASATQAQLVRNPGPSQVVRCGIVATGTYDGDLALQNPGPGEVVYAVRSDGRLLAGHSGCDTGVINDGMSGSLSGRPTLAIQSNEVFVAGSGSAPMWKFLTTAANPSPRGWVTTTTLFPSNLFLVGAGIAGGGGGGPTVGGVFAVVNPTGALDGGATINATPGSSPGGAAVVGAEAANIRYVYYGDNSGRVRRVTLTGTATIALTGAISSAQVGSVRFSERAPLLGEGGKVYVIGSDGVLRVLRADTLAEEWSWSGLFPSAAPAGAISQLNADLDRSVPSPCASFQPGVLYAASTVGGVTTLRALLVDSRGVDALAPWPRHQHNPANTGNAGTSLSQWTCP